MMNGIKWVVAISIVATYVNSGLAQEAEPDEAKALLGKLTGFYRETEELEVDGDLIISMGAYSSEAK